jgi:YbbR domain-containing protein
MRSLAGRLVEHWQLKLLSLVFATGLWAFVLVEDKGQAVYTVPLDVANVPSGLEVTAVGVEAVVVRVQGLRHVLDRLDERELRAQVDLRGARAGDLVLRIRPEDVTVPRGLEVVRVTPTQVRATVERAAGGSGERGAPGTVR